MSVKTVLGVCRLHLSGSAQGPGVGSSKNDNKPLSLQTFWY
jgi:hypothetical protein